MSNIAKQLNHTARNQVAPIENILFCLCQFCSLTPTKQKYENWFKVKCLFVLKEVVRNKCTRGRLAFLKCIWQIFFSFAWSNLNGILIWISKIIFRFRFSFPALLPFKNVKFYFRSCQKPRKGRPGHSHLVTSYQERSRGQNKLRGPHCEDLIRFICLYSATVKLSPKLCETADVISNLGSDLELLESIECELLTSKVESETELEIEKEAIQNQKVLT